MKKIYPFRITQSQGEVLMHLMNIKSLPRRKVGFIPTRYARHEKAIAELKDLGMIEKGEDNILVLKSSRSIVSQLLINNKIR